MAHERSAKATWRVLAAFATLLAVALAGCQGTPEDGGPGSGSGSGSGSIALSHVHGLAHEPGEGALYVATHHGLARGVPSEDAWVWSYVGTERYDYMGFTRDAVADRTFYSSGHPSDPNAFGGVHLGLRRSVDGGVTWEQRSLKGQVDFHALAAMPSGAGHLAGSWAGAVKVSRDGGLTWEDKPAPAAPVLALAASEGTLWAGTTAGLFRSTDLVAWTPVAPGTLEGPVSSVAASADGRTLLAGTAGGPDAATLRSLDGGQTWQVLDAAALRSPSAPVLFAVDANDARHVFASTAGAEILESRDAGATWQTIRPR